MTANREMEAFEQRLVETAAYLDYPPTPPVAAIVRQRLRHQQTAPARPTRLLAAALATVVLLLIVILTVPPVRAAVLEFLQIGAIRIFTTPATDAPTVPEISGLPELAGETTLSAAHSAVAHPLRLPTYPPDLGPPDRVYRQALGAAGDLDLAVILVWLDPQRPDRVRLSLYHIEVPYYGLKQVGIDNVQQTEVSGRLAYWVEGPHRLRLASGEMSEWLFVAGSVLVWSDGVVTYRLESGLPLQEAVRIAESLAPLEAFPRSEEGATGAPITVQMPPTATPTLTLPSTVGEGAVGCPVTLPNNRAPSGDFAEARAALGNSAGTLFTIPWPHGKVLFYPGGPGSMKPDGSLAMKWPWYRTIPGRMVISGRRLDGPAAPMPVVVLQGEPDGYGPTGFHPSELIFPGPGCWQVTAHIGVQASLTFVTEVVRLPFAPLHARWLPEAADLQQVDSDVSQLPYKISLVYRAAEEDGELRIETAQEPILSTIATKGGWLDQPSQRSAGVCIRAGWDAQLRQNAATEGSALEWASGGLWYRISQRGLELDCSDLVRVAGAPGTG
ncbi:MAG: hypothetical protein R3300_01435 [Candidatus Promineifilaceae bacterium]|nr:hypothetical protein [Candidatus Promineifilaceae bacterium]